MTYTEEPIHDGVARSADDVSIAYSVKGRGDVALVFIHGGFCNRRFWDRQVGTFADAYRVVALDLAGHGDSGMRNDWTLRAFGEDVRAVVEALELERVILCGHSMGGPVALEAAALMPERVVGAIGIDSLHDAGVVIGEPRWQARIESYRQDFRGTCENDVRMMFPEAADPELVAEVSKMMCAGSGEVAVAVLEVFSQYDMGAAMSKVGAPIRSINGDLYPTNVQGNRRYSPGYDAVILTGVGHFPMLERPDELNRELAQMAGNLGANTSK
jgi:pimeloyl-ACP methyl ester carboxylesterase